MAFRLMPGNWYSNRLRTFAMACEVMSMPIHLRFSLCATANASSRTEFSLDHSMLVLASKVDQDDDSLRHIIAGVDGVSVHRFRFQNMGMYDPRLLNAVREA